MPSGLSSSSDLDRVDRRYQSKQREGELWWVWADLVLVSKRGQVLERQVLERQVLERQVLELGWILAQAIVGGK